MYVRTHTWTWSKFKLFHPSNIQGREANMAQTRQQRMQAGLSLEAAPPTGWAPQGLQLQQDRDGYTGLSPQPSGSLLVQRRPLPLCPGAQGTGGSASRISPYARTARASSEGAERVLKSFHPTAHMWGHCRWRVCKHFSNTCDSSDKDLMIVTGCLQRPAYKMVTSLSDKPSRPDVLLRSLSNWCKVWRPESYIFHPAYCVFSFDTGSGFTFASDYQSALIKQAPALP